MATWLSYKPFTAKYPDWNMVDATVLECIPPRNLPFSSSNNKEIQALTEDVIPVMWDDAKPSSHPIVVQNITSPSDITSLFDSITYSKGASILRMLEKIVGSDTFRDGLRDYLTSNAFDVGDPSDFYNKLFANISGEAFMRNWLEEMNYPLLHVHLQSDDNGTSVTFNQSRFIISDALDASRLNSDYRWKISIQCVLGSSGQIGTRVERRCLLSLGDFEFDSNSTDMGGKTIDFLLETREESQVFPEQFYTWIKCNRHFQGFYVTQYSSTSAMTSNWQDFSSILDVRPAVSQSDRGIQRLIFIHVPSSSPTKTRSICCRTPSYWPTKA